MQPTEQDLAVVSAQVDRARRLRLAGMLVLFLIAALVALAQGTFVDLPTKLVAFAILAMGLIAAWRGGAVERARALFRLGKIKADGLAASALLNRGDFEGARRTYAALLPITRPLAGYHAMHVLLYGVTCFLVGDKPAGLSLTRRVLASEWHLRPRMDAFRDLAETWHVFMLLDAGDVAEAKKVIEARPAALGLGTARAALALHEERWEDALHEAHRALGEAGFPKASRPTIAALGLFAAKKLGRYEVVSAFEALLAAEPLSLAAKENPALKKYW